MSEFISSIKIDKVLKEIALQDSELKKLFQGCLKGIWENTIIPRMDGSVHITGAQSGIMSLSESAALMRPLCLLCHRDSALQILIRGVIDAQMQMILTDPYASSFNVDSSIMDKELVNSSPEVHQRYFSLDSILSPVQLIWTYRQSSEDESIFDDMMLESLQAIIQVLRIEQNHEENSSYDPEEEEYEHPDNPKEKRVVRDSKPNGMIWSGFRPDGRPCYYNYHIPSQMAAVLSLNALVEIFRDIYLDQDTSEELIEMQYDLGKLIEDQGIIDHPDFGEIYIYETDGDGNYILMDDETMPNLLGSPLYGFTDSMSGVYQNTRRFIFSQSNPNFIEGKQVSGLGRVKSGKKIISPDSILLGALTTENPVELDQAVNLCKEIHAGTYQMQQYFDPDDLTRIVSKKSDRANALFIELVLTRLTGIY